MSPRGEKDNKKKKIIKHRISRKKNWKFPALSFSIKVSTERNSKSTIGSQLGLIVTKVYF